MKQTAAESYHKAIEQLRSGQENKAYRTLRKLVSEYPQFAPAFATLGSLASHKGDHEPAARYVRRAISLEPENNSYRVKLSEVLLAQSKSTATSQALIQTVEKNPENPEALRAMGAHQLRIGRVSESVETLQRLIAISPLEPVALMQMTEGLVRLGRLKEALECVNLLLTVNPDDKRAEIMRGTILAAEGMVVEALQNAERVRNSYPASKRALSFYLDVKLQHDLALLPGVCAGLPAEPRVLAQYTDLIRNSIGSVDRSGTNLVFFHVSQSSEHPSTQTLEASEFSHYDLLGAAVTGGRRNCAVGCVIVLTDERTVFPEIAGIDHIVRLPLQQRWIMYERMRAQRSLLASGCMTANTLLLDTDVIVNRSFDPVFEPQYDIGLTWRVSPASPVNGGMIMVRGGSADKAARFFDDCIGAYDAITSLDCVKARYTYDIREFYGDQLAIAMRLGWKSPPAWPETTTVNDVKIRFFSCEDVNFTYGPLIDSELLSQKFAVHFKGATKQYANEFMSRTMKHPG